MTRPQESPLVSVIMNAYYSDEFLAEAIASVIAQTYTKWEIILWENESMDRALEISSSFNDPRIRYFHAPEKVSLYESRMNAFQRARGELVAFLDCDDLWMPEKLSRQVPVFEDNLCVLSSTDYLIRYEGSEAKNGSVTNLISQTYLEKISSVREVALDYRVGMSTVLVRAESARQVWPVSVPSYSVIEDFDMVVRLLTVGYLVPINEKLATYRWHGGNFSSRVDIEVLEWTEWSRNMSYLGLTQQEEAAVRNRIESRLLGMQCRHSRLKGDRIAAWRLIMQMPMSRSKAKWFFSLAVPTSLVRTLWG